MTAKDVRTLRRSLTPTKAELAQRKVEQAPLYPKAGLTLREAASRIGVSMCSWYRWERGETITASRAIMLASLGRPDGIGTARSSRVAVVGRKAD